MPDSPHLAQTNGPAGRVSEDYLLLEADEGLRVAAGSSGVVRALSRHGARVPRSAAVDSLLCERKRSLSRPHQTVGGPGFWSARFASPVHSYVPALFRWRKAGRRPLRSAAGLGRTGLNGRTGLKFTSGFPIFTQPLDPSFPSDPGL